jgi:hypothetical protein
MTAECPCAQGGELTNNIYLAQPVPLPIRWRGDVACKLVVAGTGCTIRGNQMSLEQIDTRAISGTSRKAEAGWWARRKIKDASLSTSLLR